MNSEQPTVLVVDDKRNMLNLMSKVLKGSAQVLTANNGTEAVRLLGSKPIDVVLCDLKMPDMSGLEVLEACKRLRPTAEFILMTAYATVGTAVDALRSGAYDYLTKPFDPEDAHAIVLRAAGHVRPTFDDTLEVLPGTTARSPVMREMGSLVRRVANSAATTLIMGETGTGKERIARAIHQLSPRASQRFVAINCAAIPAELLESELFGYAKGAFTGAGRDRPGLFEEADGGTLFLDEIGDLRLSLQAKLTRALEERAIRRIGEARERKINVRIVAATHRNLNAMVRNETFREDLWYRLNVALIQVPPLRDRKEDIELLATEFLRDFAESMPTRRLIGFTTGALSTMEAYDWPGNVRQLRSSVERASVITENTRIDIGDLPPEVRIGETLQGNDLAELTWSDALERGRHEAGRAYLKAVLSRNQGNVIAAAAQAGVERESFYRLLRRFGIDAVRFR